ncbi:MAG: nuclear transport factor 2 family protein [Flavobacterium sp.]
MKKLLLFAAILAVNFAQAQENEIKKTIQTFFDGMHTADTIKIKSVTHKDLILQSINDGTKKKLVTDNVSEFYKSIATIPKDTKIEERLLSYNIQQDGSMAHAWTPYEFYINDKLSHKGVNSFMLFKEDGVWRIIYIVDTRRK